ncbi:MAG: dTDP-4-dehydrorhamnose 3,5-epimerase [Limnohabitans sp.]|jgi:dTDP-4-dehydrorhamnose 3,5-epimerase|nr:dTDP-4-dehydrorhamnose 3,5-epimerase [Limnohabitans sp.]
MQAIPTEIPDVIELAPKVFGDERGFFLETWNERTYCDAGIRATFVQDNWSRSRRGILRGLHYQVQQPQGKLVRVTRGSVFDVAVDLRRSSATFGQHIGRVLSEENKRALWIPPGFAHGFLVISDEADFVYKCTEFYAPEFDRTLAWNDATVAISWPLELVGGRDAVQLSEKDRTKAASWATAETFA